MQLHPIRRLRGSLTTDQVGVAPPVRPAAAEPIQTANCAGKKVTASVTSKVVNVPEERIALINTWRTVTEALDPVDRQALEKARAGVIKVVTVTGARQGLEATLPAPNQKSYASFTF